MTKLRKQLTVLIGVISIAGLAQCSGTSYSSKTKLKVLNQMPVIITAPVTITLPLPANSAPGTPPTTQTITANWFLYTLEIDNNSTEELTVVNNLFTLTGVDNNGVTQTQTASLDVATPCNGGSTDVTRAYLAIIPPGGIYTHLSDPTACDATTAVGGQPFENWYVDNLNVNVTNWEVEVQAVGWFTDTSTGEPNERLTLYSYFSTQ